MFDNKLIININVMTSKASMAKNIGRLLILLQVVIPRIDCGVGHNKELQKLSKAHFEFSIDLYRQTALNQESGNIVISPYAANLGVALMFLGSSSNTNTSTELRLSLHAENIPYVELHKSFKKIINTLQDPYYKKHNFTSHIRIFLQKGVGIKSQYLRAVREFYQSQVQEIDFGASGSGHITTKINSWMNSSSGGKFHQLLQRDPNYDTRLVLASYTSMKPRFLYPFDARKTSYNGLFFLPGGERLQVAMMNGQFEVPVGYSEQLTSRLLELPLLERRMSMFLVLPDSVEPGISGLEERITTDFVKELRATLKTEVVNVRLPKFKIEQTTEFSDILSGLGVSQVLDPAKADLENMVDKNILHLSSFKHRAEIEVTEAEKQQTIETQATSVGILRQKFFEVDHPFVYFVWDYYTGTILLIGRVIQPITV